MKTSKEYMVEKFIDRWLTTPTSISEIEKEMNMRDALMAVYDQGFYDGFHSMKAAVNKLTPTS
jgi:hypothetical protein